MKLNEFYSKPIKDALEEMTMVDLKLHSDEAGNIRAVEIKYTVDAEIKIPQFLENRNGGH